MATRWRVIGSPTGINLDGHADHRIIVDHKDARSAVAPRLCSWFHLLDKPGVVVHARILLQLSLASELSIAVCSARSPHEPRIRRVATSRPAVPGFESGTVPHIATSAAKHCVGSYYCRKFRSCLPLSVYSATKRTNEPAILLRALGKGQFSAS
jgi:hypothetical protein